MSKPINLSAGDVAQLLASGRAEVCRPVAGSPDELPPTRPFQLHEWLWGRESVARRHKDDTQWHYRADGYAAGRFYLKNYHMPRPACRWHLLVEAEQLEQRTEGWVQLLTIAHDGLST